MADFQSLQRQLADARASRDQAQAVLFRTTEQLKRVEADLEQAARGFDPRSEPDLARRRALEQRKATLQRLVDERQGALKHVEGALAGLLPQFWNDWSDPRTHADKLDDALPIALFPLRLETRFKTIARDNADGRQLQLWVRIYPDECVVDTFEETLSEVELHSARIFWREYFRAAGVEAEERAAWRGLVASHGSGRASWIVRQFRPRNPLFPGDPAGDPALDPKPQSKNAGELLLVVAADASLLAAERPPLAQYWTAVWQADGDRALETAARGVLEGVVGAARAATLATQFAPYNLSEAPAATFTRATTTVRVVFLLLPSNDDVEPKTRSWMKAAEATLLPERFVLLGYRDGAEVLNVIGAPVQGPFAVSPDPTADPATQFQFDANGNLTVGDNLRWMLDFDEAVRRGMGFRVDLTAQQAAGFDRLLVLGIRLASDAAKGKAELETLLQHHYFSRTGLAFLPQGAATNNTDDGNSAYSRADDADAAYDFVFKGRAQFTETQEWLDKRDGQWFAECLGLDTEWLKQVPHAGGLDQCEGRAMNAALWPATLGYFMDTLLQPVFDDDAIYYARWFFNRFVSGRGMIPAVRIGRQPYGVLPTCAFRRIGWVAGGETPARFDYARRSLEQRGTPFQVWLPRFKAVLDRLFEIWRGLATGASYVGRQDRDPHQALLDIVGLHPASVEFHQRYASTQKQEHNIAALWQRFVSWETLPANELHNEAFLQLTQLGYTGLEVPRLFDLFWKVTANRLNGPVIQEGALSETEALRNVTVDDHNYIEWLHEWARLSFDVVRVQDGFREGQTPTALLYLLLKHALELGYYDAGVRLLDDALLLDPQARRNLRNESHFFHIETPAAPAAAGTATEQSRYEVLYTPNARVTGDDRTLLVDHLTRGIGVLFPTRYLTEQLDALDRLARTPTARLERAFAEHLDCCTYRLDAWMSGLVNFQLQSMRYAASGDGEPGENPRPRYRTGVYVGAYGWLENVHAEDKVLTPVRLTGELDRIFNVEQPQGQAALLVRDDTNEGYVHAPSVNHAVTAAVLRNGYIANATPAQPDLLKVGLSSERVRTALGIIEGIRNGQSLAALLGYQFERGLHDRYEFAESDQFIYPLRLIFPLVTQPNDLPEGVSIETVEARNVVNGLNLLRHVKDAAPADKIYPFGFPNTRLPDATPAQKAVIGAEIDRLLDVYDALADLAIAEGVHQVVMGNYDRAAATLDAYGQATFPPIPDVVQTPRSGIVLTHRVAVQLDATAAAAGTDNPRVKAEPSLNRWLASLLPPAGGVGCAVHYVDAATGDPRVAFVTQADLGLQALDLVHVMQPDNLQARTELEDRVRDVVLRRAALNVRPDLLGEVAYREAAAGQLSVFEVAAMVRSVRALVLRSRALRVSDVALPTEVVAETAAVAMLDRGRVDFLPAALTSVRTTRLVPLDAQLDAAFPAAGPDVATIVAAVDGYLDQMIAACRELAMYGLAGTGFGVLLEGRAGVFKQLLGKAAATAVRWQGKLDVYEALLLELAGIADESQRIELLAKAERLVATDFTDPAGKTSAQVLAIVQGKAAALRARQLAFRDLQRMTGPTIAAALASFTALLPVAAFDLQPVTTEDEEKQLVTLAADIRARVKQLITDVVQRADGVTARLAEHDGTADPEKRVQLLVDAARSVFGEEFVLVPSFSLASTQGQEWSNAYAARAQLLDYQKTQLGNDYAVDDWLHGAARVREKLRHVENLELLAETLGTTPPALAPVQFPYRADAVWMALQFPADAKPHLERELLLYTAHYSTPFNPAAKQCGLLLDEWTEVIPAETETTGIAFHFDKPGAEPPQAILLATPPQFTGAWRWDDLVATLHETLDLARIRAVEPAQLDQTALAVFLPATIMATTWRPITIAADLAVVNKFVERIS
jgi:hypothetical protein